MEFHLLPGIGKINVKVNARTRKVSIKIDRKCNVTLTYPSNYSREKAIAFLESKEEWIAGSIGKVKSRMQEEVFNFPLHTRKFTVQIEKKDSKTISAKRSDNTYHLFCPKNLAEDSAEIKAFASKILQMAYRIEAEEILPQRIRFLSEKHNLKCGKITIRNNKTRWGSCSGKNDISLSLWLVSLPDHLIEHVLLHELCHTKIKNHSLDFYNLLNKVNNCKVERYRKELRKFSPGNYYLK